MVDRVTRVLRRRRRRRLTKAINKVRDAHMTSGLLGVQQASVILLFDWADFGVSTRKEASDEANVEHKDCAYGADEHEQ